MVETEERAAGLSVDKMNSSVEFIPRILAARRSRWLIPCSVLVAFNLVAFGIVLDLTHRLMAVYADSARIHREWSNRLGRYSELGELAAAVHAAGNDLFEIRDEAAESANLDKAIARFREKTRELREETNSRLPVTEAGVPLEEMDALQEALDQMTGEASLIFSCFRGNHPEEAAKHLVAMDREFAHLNAILLRLQSVVSEIQEAQFGHQLARASSVSKIETALGLTVMLMLVATAFYASRAY